MKEKEFVLQKIRIIEFFDRKTIKALESKKTHTQRKDYNTDGSLTNIILCYIENKVILNAVQYLMNEGYKFDVFVFHGCMVRKEDKESLSEYVYE